MDQHPFSTPFAERYGTSGMRTLWSEHHQRVLWRSVWCALAEAQGRPTRELRAHICDIDRARARIIEGDTKHDLVAELRVYQEQCPKEGRYLHQGATSSDIQDNADLLRTRMALYFIEDRLILLLLALVGRIVETAEMPCTGYTHLQAAEPTTTGYRLAQYGQDLLADLLDLRRVRAALRGKGFKGAVGASNELLYDAERWATLMLDIEPFPVTTQVAPRKQEWRVINVLAGIAASLHRYAFDVRLLQSFGQWAEPFDRDKQVGSSAMPYKRNPIQSEKVCSLARWVANLPRVAWDNAGLSLLERTLDDSANRRLLLPEAFLATEEMLITMATVTNGLTFDQEAIAAKFDAHRVIYRDTSHAASWAVGMAQAIQEEINHGG